MVHGLLFIGYGLAGECGKFPSELFIIFFIVYGY
jgi:hypothetical protein